MILNTLCTHAGSGHTRRAEWMGSNIINPDVIQSRASNEVPSFSEWVKECVLGYNHTFEERMLPEIVHKTLATCNILS